MAAEYLPSLQDAFLHHLRENKIPVLDVPGEWGETSGLYQVIRQVLGPTCTGQ
jgi:hypothetical protein